MSLDANGWIRVLTSCGVRKLTASKWAPVFARVIDDKTFSSPSDLATFLGQILHESGQLEILVESLNYSTAERLCAVWPSRFPSVSAAAPYVHNPDGLAEKVYGGRMGNNTPGDGAKYRGRGLLMCTGKDCYRAVGKALGVDLVAAPERLAEPELALRSAIAWWEKNIPDAALGDVYRVSKLVNGGTVGLADRKILSAKAKAALE